MSNSIEITSDNAAIRKTTKVFVNSNLTHLLDAFFDDNEIGSLNFKCNTWDKAKRAAHSKIKSELREYFKDQFDVEKVVIALSQDCEKSREDSPVFLIRGLEYTHLRGVDMQIDLTFDQANIDDFKQQLASLESELVDEIQQQIENPLVAETDIINSSKSSTKFDENNSIVKNFKNCADYQSERTSILIGKHIGRTHKSSLSTIWSKIQTEDFAMLTSFRSERSYQENLKLLNFIIRDLKRRDIGVYLIDGYFPEINKNTGERFEASENSIIVVRPDDMSIEKFTDIIVRYISDRKFTDGQAQESALMSFAKELPKSQHVKDYSYYSVTPNSVFYPIGSELTLNEAGEYYSRIRNTNLPFVFEGLRIPNSWMNALLLKSQGLEWL